MKDEINFFNYLSLNVLDYIGNDSPSNEQVLFVENLLSTMLIKKTILLDERLTPREKTCLFYAALGETTSQTAKLMCIDITTVTTYRKAIIKKLNAKNIVHAVYIGIRHGLISEFHDKVEVK